MRGETLNAPPFPPRAAQLPRHLLFSIFARIGGSGLDVDAFEALRASHRAGFLRRAIAYDNRQTEIPAALIQSLRWHPVRLLSSFVDRSHYYGAKKKYLDWVAARQLATGRYDFFHSWSGDCLQTLRVAQKRGLPSLVEIPTWHRDWAGIKPSPRQGNWKDRFLLERERFLEEYQLATLLAVLSETAAETFRVRGFPEEKLFYLPRGVDIDRFRPGARPEIFRVIFSGALIERKGIHHLLEAWHRLELKNAELWLVGSVHKEAKRHLARFWRDNIRVVGFVKNVETYLRQATIHAFPSTCEGSAKVVYEAAACGLPQVTTREAGDVVRDSVEGITIQPGNIEQLADAIRHLYDHPEIVTRMGEAARARVVENFTWDHFRARLLQAYAEAMKRCRGGL